MSFFTALSGLNAATADLEVISNNIANSNTTGFKESRAEFADLFYSADGIGHGVYMSRSRQEFAQGSIDSTGNPLDLAISGEGFFRLDDNGGILYTRSGVFGADREGYIVNNQNQRLTGYPVTANGSIGTELGPLKIDTSAYPPKPSTEITIDVNLAAETESIDTTTTPFDPANPDSYNFSSSVAVYDSLGVTRTLSTYFVRPDTTTNDWEVYFTLDGGVPFDDSTTPSTPTLYGPETLSFDATGTLAPDTGIIELNDIASGTSAAPLNLALDFSSVTQFGNQFTTQNLNQNGYGKGQFIGVEVDTEGTLLAQYDNGQTQTLGRIVLANFNNVAGLSPSSDTNWRESGASGPPILGQADTGQYGLIRAGSLEGSNVDLTEELVKMINAQRNFQANAQMISTNDQLTQTIINLR